MVDIIFGITAYLLTGLLCALIRDRTKKLDPVSSYSTLFIWAIFWPIYIILVALYLFLQENSVKKFFIHNRKMARHEEYSGVLIVVITMIVILTIFLSAIGGGML